MPDLERLEDAGLLEDAAGNEIVKLKKPAWVGSDLMRSFETLVENENEDRAEDAA